MIDFKKIKTYSIKNRKNLVNYKDFIDIKNKSFLDSLPDIYAGKDLKELAKKIVKVSKNKKMIIAMMGGHVVKVGLNPLIIHLMRKGIITHIAVNGAFIIHDFEIALIGETSEDVGSSLEDGSFGMAKETGSMLNNAINKGATNNIGIGKAVGEMINQLDLKFKRYSVLAQAYTLGVPVTVHVAIGTDIIHMHPSCSGAATGKASYQDFKIFADSVSKLENGVVLNIGSAVLLPEVFLKALSISRNLGYKVENFTAANFDMIKHYRPLVNVVQRPTKKGKGFNFIGHHEIMIPLLARCILEEMRK